MSIVIFLLLLVGVAIILLSLIWWRKYNYYFKNLSTVPVPWFVPIFGNLLHFRKPVDAFWIFHHLLMTLGKAATLRISVGFIFGVAVADPVLIERLLNHSSAQNKVKAYNFFRNWLGDGLLISNGDKWRSRRKLLAPAYHFKILQQFVSALDKNANILVHKMRPMEGNNRVNVKPYITLCALDIICETAMGTPVNAQLQSTSSYVQGVKEMKQMIAQKARNILAHYNLTYRFTFDFHREKKILKVLHDYTRGIIAARKNKLIVEQAMRSNEIECDSEIRSKKKVPFLDLLLSTSLSDEDIREEVDTFTLAGHDSVAIALSFAVYNLSKHPAIQQRVLEEQKEIFQDDPDREAVYNDLTRMKYLEMVIKESLRLFPPFPFIARDVSEDFQVGDLVFKKGLHLFIVPYCVHHNPAIYPNPEVFDPERFTSEACAKRHPYAYLPFSAGYRNCIGQKFAMLEMKSTISKLVRNFEFTNSPNSDLKLRAEVVLRSVTGFHVGITKRIW